MKKIIILLLLVLNINIYSQMNKDTIKFNINKKIRKYDYYYLVVRDMKTNTIYQRISLYNRGTYILNFDEYYKGYYIINLYNNGKLIESKRIKLVSGIIP